MTFRSPWGLVALLVIPVLIGLYTALVLPRRSSAARPFALTEAGNGAPIGWRRLHLPFALFIVAIGLLLLGFARPEMDVTLPVRTGKVVLVFDTSNSMAADDLSPTRLELAKDAARAFVDEQPGSIQVGVVAFTDGGLVVQRPTKNDREILAAIDRLSTDGGTAIAEGIFAALTAIADEAIVIDPEVAAVDIAALDIGYFSNAVIVLLSDGEEIDGADPLELAGLAANAGVRIHAVGIGTPRGTVVELDGFSIATALDETLLTEIAETTGGTYFDASEVADLPSIFGDVQRRFERQGETIEVTGLLAMAASAFLVAAGALSLHWFGRVP